MKFVEYKDVSKNRVRELQDNQVRIQQNWYALPCAISAHQVITNDQFHIDISTDCFNQLTQIAPADLMLIGRSSQQLTFDITWHRLLVEMNQQGMGLEQMSHSAAVRTFNVLMTEERPFWLILV